MTSNKKVFILAIGISFILLNISVLVGSGNVNLVDVYKVIFNKVFNMPFDVSKNDILLIWNVRLPRVLMAFIVGFAISMSGCIMQQVLRNPLASTYTMGVSGGASIGIAIFVILGISSFTSNLLMGTIAFAFGLVALFIVLHISNIIDKSLNNSTIVLVGFVISIFTNSLLMTLATFNKDKFQKIMSYQLGSFAYSNFNEIAFVSIAVLFCLILLLIFRYEIDILSFGENTGLSLGVDVQKVKLIAIIISAILCGVSVAFAGIIAFVDLIAPHISRKFVGSKIIYSTVLAGFIGGSLMLLSDLIARSIIAPAEISVGIITSLIGAPFFLTVFLKERGDRKF